MALFREHVSVGAVAGAIGVTLLYFYALVTNPWLLLLLFLVTTAASFLPDLDSDSGVPFYTVFGLFTLGCTSFALYFTLTNYPHVWYTLVGIPAATLLFVWFIVGGIFKHFTKHRGIMHSIPAMGIVGLLAFLAARHLAQGETVSWWFAAAAALGFATHLILDEVHSEVNFEGVPFAAKKSLGTALKLFSQSKMVTISTYILLLFLGYVVWVG
ncbi:MAG: metal-dependent hydrolase [Patescibacteria group bacterium]